MINPKLERYDAYKSTDVEWLSQAPTHWGIKRLKDIGTSIIGLTYSPEDVVDDEFGGVLVLRSSNIQNKILDLSNTVYVNKNIPPRLILRKGDILICSRNGSRSLIGKNICIDERTAGQTFGAFMTVYRTKHFEFLSKFFNSSIFESQSGLFMSSTVNQLTQNTLNNFFILLPPLLEQKAIADYLDAKTAQIDRKTDLLTQKAEKYVDLKQSLINETVTHGLDKNIPMKDSGVEWIGQVPAHWEVKHFKQFSTMKGRIGWQGLKQSEFTDEGPFLITGMNFKKGKINWSDVYHISNERYEEAPEIQLKNNDILMTKDGTIGKLLFVEDIPFPHKASLNSHLLVFRPIKKSYYPKYMLYQLDSLVFKLYTETVKLGTTFFGISQESVGRYIAILPPLEEQKAIAKYLDTKTVQIERIIETINAEIEKLKELRKTLINDVVTGKIKVS